MPGAVVRSRIEEIDPRIESKLNGADRFLIIHFAPTSRAAG
jgi:hypothetical protein